MKKIISIAWIIVVILANGVLYAQNKTSITEVINNRPNPPKLVNDYTNTLTKIQIDDLERKLVTLDDSTFTQIAVVIVHDLDGKDVADAALQLGRKWGVGNKKNNSGVVLLIAKDDRKLNISPGYGLEGALPDITAGHIIKDIIVPRFKGDDYYRGIDEGTDAIIQAVKGEYKTPRIKDRSIGTAKLIVIIIVIIIFLLIASQGGGKGGSFMSRRGYRGFGGGPVFWPTGGGSGWGGGGSSGGGGFGGFGGGSFGGGGASGSW